jgi:predicted RND superfamily exporter protein
MNKEKFALGVIKYRWPIVLLTPLLIILLFAANMKKGGFETDWKIWFVEDSYVMQNFEQFKKTFGSDDRLLIALRHKDGIFQKEILKNIQAITKELWQTKSIARVDSITNYQYSFVSSEDPDEIILEDFIDDIASLSSSELQRKKEIATTDIQTKNLLISEDGKTAVIVARMVYSESMAQKDYITLYHAANAIVEKHRVEGVEYHVVGIPAFMKAFTDAIKSNISTFLPILLGVMTTLLLIIFRNIWGLVLPMSVVILTTLCVAGLSFGLGYKLNTITSMFPIFIIAVGIATSIHFFWIWIHRRQDGYNNTEGILFSMNKNLAPALITSLTTFAGFLSLGISEIVPLQAFGIIVASGAIISFLLSITFLPALLSVINPNIKKQKHKSENAKIWIKKYTNFVVRYDRQIIVLMILFIVISATGFKNVSVDTDFMKQFSPQTQIRKSADFVQKHIGGTISIEIIVDSKEKTGIYRPDFMKSADIFKEEFKARFEQVRHVGSLANVIKRYNRLFHADDELYYKIPDSKELISQYMLLYSISLPKGMGINDMMDVDSRYLRITTMIDVSSELEKLEMYDWAREWWSENSSYSATVEGLTMISAHMRMELTNTMIKSISLALIFVTLIFWLAFKSRFYMAISTIPNIGPLLITIGITGWLSINLDLGMAIVFVVIIGVAVDDAVHFISKYNTALQNGKNVRESIEESLLISGGAIVTTTAVLVLGFGTFIFSNFTFYSNFGLMSALALFFAMVLDLLLLPAILSYLDKRSDKKIKKFT